MVLYNKRGIRNTSCDSKIMQKKKDMNEDFFLMDITTKLQIYVCQWNIPYERSITIHEKILFSRNMFVLCVCKYQMYEFSWWPH